MHHYITMPRQEAPHSRLLKLAGLKDCELEIYATDCLSIIGLGQKPLAVQCCEAKGSSSKARKVAKSRVLLQNTRIFV